MTALHDLLCFLLARLRIYLFTSIAFCLFFILWYFSKICNLILIIFYLNYSPTLLLNCLEKIIGTRWIFTGKFCPSAIRLVLNPQARPCQCQWSHDSLPFTSKTICLVAVIFGICHSSWNQLGTTLYVIPVFNSGLSYPFWYLFKKSQQQYFWARTSATHGGWHPTPPLDSGRSCDCSDKENIWKQAADLWNKILKKQPQLTLTL